jgi:phosphatidylserine decarboxylase
MERENPNFMIENERLLVATDTSMHKLSFSAVAATVMIALDPT